MNGYQNKTEDCRSSLARCPYKRYHYQSQMIWIIHSGMIWSSFAQLSHCCMMLNVMVSTARVATRRNSRSIEMLSQPGTNML